jgi:hypothetical protein
MTRHCNWSSSSLKCKLSAGRSGAFVDRATAADSHASFGPWAPSLDRASSTSLTVVLAREDDLGQDQLNGSRDRHGNKGADDTKQSTAK